MIPPRARLGGASSSEERNDFYARGRISSQVTIRLS